MSFDVMASDLGPVNSSKSMIIDRKKEFGTDGILVLAWSRWAGFKLGGLETSH